MRGLWCVLACAWVCATGAFAGPVVVGVKPAEPFVIRGADGEWAGIAIDLWERVAAETGLEFEYVERPDVSTLLADVSSGALDVGVGAVTVTAERERAVDFTHLYYAGGLAIAVPAERGGGGLLRSMAGLVTPAFLTGVGGLVVLLGAVGLVVWIAERRRNAEQFGGGPVRGLGNAFWFSAVTMTTVGYGDKAPVTLAGRLVTLVWMFASIIVISFFTGAIASAFTASALQTGVQGPEDLARGRVGYVVGTDAEGRLGERGVRGRGFADVQAGLEALAGGDLDAFVHDDAIVRFRVSMGFASELRVLDATFAPFGYAMALPPGSERRESINRALLSVTGNAAWREAIRRAFDGG